MISYFKSFFIFCCIFELNNFYVAVGWVFMRVRVFPIFYWPWRRKRLPSHLLEMRTTATMLLLKSFRINDRLTQNFIRNFATGLTRCSDSRWLNHKIRQLARLCSLSNNFSFIGSRLEKQSRLLQLVIWFEATSRCLVKNLLDFPILLAQKRFGHISEVCRSSTCIYLESICKT